MGAALVIVIPFLLAGGIFSVRRALSANMQGWVLGSAMLLLFAALLTQLPLVTEEGAITGEIPWVPALGLSFAIYLDGLSLLFALVITGVGAAVMLYAGYYFEDGIEAGRFYGLLLAFTGSMLALVLAGNILTLFIAWELTSIISFLLISFHGEDTKARVGGLQALMVTGGGGLALLAGLILLGSAAGTTDLSVILSSGDLLREHTWYTAFTVLIIIGCFSKSAQWPLHFWLPQAMTAPTPASAFLHSATMVKAGIYLLLRLHPVLGDTALWDGVLPAFGLVTMAVGAVLALRQRDLKGCLAFSTISQLGAFVALIGLPESHGIKAALVGVLAHALYKGALFLVVGAVDHAAGTRELDHLGGRRSRRGGVAVVTALAAVSMAGVPPLLGFIAKETLLESVLETPLALLIVVFSAALTVTMAFIIFWDVFMRPAPDHTPTHDDHHTHHHDIARPMVYGPAVMAGLSVVLGLGVGPLITPLVQPAVGKSIKLYLFAPEIINTPFLLSMAALIAGSVLFWTRQRWLALPMPSLPSGPQVYRGLVRGVETLGDWVLKTQAGKLRYYLVVILLAVIGLMATTGLISPRLLRGLALEVQSASDILKAFLLLLSLVATLASILFRRHLLAALALGVAGYSIGGIFLLEPAPDVALVQFLVETLGTILIIMILTKTSEAERKKVMESLWGGQSRIGLWRDITISGAVGLGVALFALSAVGSRPTPQPVSLWHLRNAYPETGAKDIVAAIVTDFRGMDTVIEITVFGIAALGVLTLLATPEIARPRRLPAEVSLRFRRLLRRKPLNDVPIVLPDTPPSYQPLDLTPEEVSGIPAFSNALTRLAARLVMPFAFLVSLAHIMYGGSAPGDGFTAGVISGLGVALWYVVFGYFEARQRLSWLHPARLIGLGLLLTLLNAVLPLLFGREFLAFSRVETISLPADLKLASSLVFEIGIFLTVFGGISAVMEAITHPKEVETL